jgi:hypothetical protein
MGRAQRKQVLSVEKTGGPLAHEAICFRPRWRAEATCLTASMLDFGEAPCMHARRARHMSYCERVLLRLDIDLAVSLLYVAESAVTRPAVHLPVLQDGVHLANPIRALPFEPRRPAFIFIRQCAIKFLELRQKTRRLVVWKHRLLTNSPTGLLLLSQLQLTSWAALDSVSA